MDDNLIAVADIYRDHLAIAHKEFLLTARIRILVVVDTEISLTSGPGVFGIGRLVKLLRDTKAGCTRFDVTLARRSTVSPMVTAPNPSDTQPKYDGFRFDATAGGKPVIDGYDEIWLYGFKPDNFDGPDSNITQPGALPLSDGELETLTRWMNERQGGVFATGDHDYLGASMCHRIPRVGSMRKWTNADGVPPIGGPTRIDTNRPATPGQADIGGSPELIPNSVETDGIPQPIQWIAWQQHKHGHFVVHKRPHPVLCHPTLGPINVMPDHPHEGLCFTESEINLAANYAFNGYAGPEYPSSGGSQPGPRVIAWGKTLSDPPYDFAKGPHTAKNFPMISVYDGHVADVGRVAVDSTWHHHFDMNILGIEAAADPTNWQKISRYFVNLAVWLAPPGRYKAHCFFDFVKAHFEYVGMLELHPKIEPARVGHIFRDHLVRHYGPCWVTSFVLDWLRDFNRKLHERILVEFFDGPIGPKGPRPEPCLSCPPWDFIEQTLLGHMALSTRELALELRRSFEAGERRKFQLEAFQPLMYKGLETGWRDLSRLMEHDSKRLRQVFQAVQAEPRIEAAE
ncbi:MAG: hypothetical protein ACFCUW_08905 [Kiloniellaceae bacterium]